MFASRLMSRSPVWLRKIPSTVSGSQGSRRGLRPAVRFAFPLGARLNITLRARPCQELFFRKFLAAVPRAAGRLSPSGPLPFAATSSVLYAPPPRRGREAIPHTGCRQLRRGKAEGGGECGAGGRPGLAATSGRSPGRRAGPPGSRLRRRPRKKKDGRLRSPPALRAGRPSATVPSRFSLYLYIDMFSSGCRKCAWSSSRNAATRPWERPSLQACSRSSP